MLCRACPRHHRRHRRGDLRGARRKGERDVDGLNAWVGDMTGDGSFDAEKLGEDAGVDELADGIEEAFAERWDARREAMGEEAFGGICRRALLRSLDQRWVDHLVDMDHLRQGVGLRGLAQRDPLVEYKREALDSFGNLVREIYADFLRIMLRLEVEGTSGRTRSCPGRGTSATRGAASPRYRTTPTSRPWLTLPGKRT